MKKLIPALVAAFTLAVTTSVHAVLMVYGTLSGTVVTASGTFAVGMPVSGYFRYDYDLLSPPDASGLRTIPYYSGYPNYTWPTFTAGTPSNGIYGGGYAPGLVVDANGFPYSGNAAGTPDILISPGGQVGAYLSGFGGWGADVTYTITGVPDSAATWILLGLGLAGVTLARRFNVSLRTMQQQ